MVLRNGRRHDHSASIVNDQTPTDVSAADFNVNRMVIDFLATDPEVTLQRTPRRSTGGPTRPWVSEVGKCHRAVGFRLAGAPVTNSVDPNDTMNWHVGLIVQAIVQQAAEWHFGRDQFLTELPVRVPLVDSVDGTVPGATIVRDGKEMLLSGRADGLLVAHEPFSGSIQPLEVWEVKKVARYKWQLIMGQKRGKEAAGPRKEDVWQANLAGYALGALWVRVVYIVTDANRGEPRIADFKMPVDDMQAAGDLLRMSELWATVHDRKQLPQAYWPAEDKVLDNPKGPRWPCGWCSYQDACVDVGTSDEVSLPIAPTRDREEVSNGR